MENKDKQQIKEDSKIFAAVMAAIVLGCAIVSVIIYILYQF